MKSESPLKAGWHWTDEEIQLLRDNSALSDNVLADKLGRSVKSILHKREILGLVKNRAWTDDEIRLVGNNPDLSLLELSKLVGRPTSSCHRYRQLINTGEVTFTRDATARVVTVREPDPVYRGELARLALRMAEGNEDLALILLKEMTDPSDDSLTLGEICGR